MLLKKPARLITENLFQIYFFLVSKSSCTKFWRENMGFTLFVLFCCESYCPNIDQKKCFIKSYIYLYLGNMSKVCRTTFAVYKLHNLTKILLIAHITQLNFSGSNFNSNGEIWNLSITALDQLSLIIVLNLCLYFFIATFIRTVIVNNKCKHEIWDSLHYSILSIIYCFLSCIIYRSTCK